MKWVSAVVLLFSAMAWAQAPPPSAPDAAAIVSQQFGPAFTLAPKFSALVGDFDGDGVEDLLLVATSTEPLPDQIQFHYKVIDPYHAYFGFGDPKVTMQFGTFDGSVPRVLLVIHSWRAATPKAKFVVLNVPFERISLGRLLLKKKVVNSIRAEEGSGFTASLYWTGKQYKWEPTGMN